MDVPYITFSASRKHERQVKKGGFVWVMREDIAPFEYREVHGRNILWLHGESQDKPAIVNEDKVHIIRDAIVEACDIDIEHAIIKGDIYIWSIIARLNKDEKIRRDDDDDIFIIQSNIYMKHCQIIGYANFFKTSIEGCADFEGTIFFGFTRFFRFNNYVNFRGVKFKKYACFESAIFDAPSQSYYDFGNAHFFGVADFTNTKFCTVPDANFTGTKFEVTPRFNDYNQIEPQSFDIIALSCKKAGLIGTGDLFKMAGEGYLSNIKYHKASDSFRNARVEYDKEGKRRESSAMYVKEMECIKESSGWCKKYLLYWPWELICKYGESWVRFALGVFGIIGIFALIYTPRPWGIIEFGNYPYSLDNNFWDSLPTALYLSISTFASFGNLEPVNNFGKFCVSSELLLGYLMFGVLITLVARKMTRS